MPKLVHQTNQIVLYCAQKRNTFACCICYFFGIVIFQFVFFTGLMAQNTVATETSYEEVIRTRTAKILNNIDIADSLQYQKVHQLLQQQYIQLNKVHDQHKNLTAAILKNAEGKSAPDVALQAAAATKQKALQVIHNQFLIDLGAQLNANQIEKVKDGMTYGILPLTWNAYLEMLQQLTPDQKIKMYNWLLEARELAMDEGSSDAKHAVFGKYKGKINNYLSAAGYNMKEEGIKWAERIKAAKEEKKQ